MIINNDSGMVEYLEAEVLKELRKSARVYQKLDFVYLAATSAIITILNLKNYALFEFTYGVWFLIIWFLMMLTIDTLIEQYFFKKWITSNRINADKCKITTALNIMQLQPFLHLCFLYFVILGSLAYAHAHVDIKNEFLAMSTIQEATDSFI